LTNNQKMRQIAAPSVCFVALLTPGDTAARFHAPSGRRRLNPCGRLPSPKQYPTSNLPRGARLVNQVDNIRQDEDNID
jgi:hypothetical protein